MRQQHRICMILLMIIMMFALPLAAAGSFGESVAGYGSKDRQETEEVLTPKPFSMRIRFDDVYEELSEGDTVGWCSVREDGTYVWDDQKVSAYFELLKEKYDSPVGEVAFTTHDGVKKIFQSDLCGWHMNVGFTAQNLEYAVQEGKTQMDPAWNSGLVYSSENGVGNSYLEVSIDKQKVYLYKDGREIYETDCVTGTAGVSETRKGVFQLAIKSSPATLRDVDQNGEKYEQPVEYWMAFNGSQGLHDAIWRGSFGGDIYKSWGSHGCVNLSLEAAARIYSEIYLYYPVIVY